ncbi:hypothetical protein SLE2022_367130 [Rubroshorea leprosula]
MEQPLVPRWAQNYTKLGSRTVAENDMMMSALLWQKLGSDLMRNCDLPPPVKVFTVSKKVVISPINRICNMMGREYGKDRELQMTSFTMEESRKHLRYCCHERRGSEGKGHSGMPSLVALGFCLGIAGVGLAFGCRYFL